MKKVFLSEICDIQIGRTPSRAIPSYWGEGESWVSIADLNNITFINSTKESITHEAVQECNCKRIPTNTVLFSFKLSIGKVAITQKALFTNEAIAALLPLTKKDFFSKYLYYALNSLNLDGVTDRAVMGHTLNKKKLARIQIPLCPLNDQKQIVQTLDTADTLRQKRKEQLNLLDDYLKSVFLDMFGDPVKNKKGWGEKPLSSYLEFLTSGSRGWAKYYSDKGGKFLRIQNVGLGRILLDDIAYVTAPTGAEAKRTKVQPNDVLMSITADLGRACVVPGDIGDAYINQHLSVLRLKQGLNPYYLSYYIVSDGGRLKLLQKNKGGVKAGLNFDDIKSLLVFLPPIYLQNKFASIVKQVEQTKQKMSASLDEMDNHFNALMQRYFG